MGQGQSTPEKESISLEALPTEIINQIALVLPAASDVVNLYRALHDPTPESKDQIFWPGILNKFSHGIRDNLPLTASLIELRQRLDAQDPINPARNKALSIRKILVGHVLQVQSRQPSRLSICTDCLGPVRHNTSNRNLQLQLGLQLCFGCHVDARDFVEQFRKATTIDLLSWACSRDNSFSALDCVKPVARITKQFKVLSMTLEQADFISTIWLGHRYSWRVLVGSPKVANPNIWNIFKNYRIHRFAIVSQTAELILHWPNKPRSTNDRRADGTITELLPDLDGILISGGAEVFKKLYPRKAAMGSVRDVCEFIDATYKKDASAIGLESLTEDHVAYKRAIRRWGTWVARQWFYRKLALENGSYLNTARQPHGYGVAIYELDLDLTGSFANWRYKPDSKTTKELKKRVYGGKSTYSGLSAEAATSRASTMLAQYLFKVSVTTAAMNHYHYTVDVALNDLLWIAMQQERSGGMKKDNRYGDMSFHDLGAANPDCALLVPTCLIRAIKEVVDELIDELGWRASFAHSARETIAQRDLLVQRLWSSDVLRDELSVLRNWARTKHVWVVLAPGNTPRPPILDWLETFAGVNTICKAGVEVQKWAAGMSMKLFAYEVVPRACGRVIWFEHDPEKHVTRSVEEWLVN